MEDKFQSDKTIVENESDLKLNEEEKKKPHPLLRMQKCMLDDQLFNPKINVHNLTRLYRYKKAEINIEKFLNCFNKVVRHHPAYLTVVHKNDDDSEVQIYKPELFSDIKLEKTTEKNFNENILPNILTNFQFNLWDKLLINFRLIETEKYLYQLMDHHHIFFDGYSIKLLMDNLERLYKDEPIITDLYYLRLKELEEMKNSPEYNEIINYMNTTYNLKEPCGCPKKDEDNKENKGLDFYKFSIKNLKQKLYELFKENDICYNNFIVMASMCAIAKHANKKDIMVTWSYHGRDNLKLKYTAGNLVRLYPVRYFFKDKIKISEFNDEIVKQAKYLIKKPYYPHILYSEDGEIMNNIYQKDFNKVFDFCGVKRESVKVPPKNLEGGDFTNQVIDACYNMSEDSLDIEWQYPYSKYKKETMNEFKNLFIKYCFKLIEHWNDENYLDLMALIDEKIEKQPKSEPKKLLNKKTKSPIDTEQEKLFSENNKILINFLGDSITEGLKWQKKETFVFYLSKWLNIQVNNQGYHATTIAVQKDDPNDFNSRINKLNSKANFTFVFGGTNDYEFGTAEMGDENSEDNLTFYGAVKNLVKNLIKVFSEKKICFILPIARYEENKKYMHGNLEEYREIIREVCKKNNVDFLEIEELKIPESSGKTEFYKDGLHPNKQGHKIIARCLIEYLKNKGIIDKKFKYTE